ncbi:hypothetical protein [Mucilaginibacter sp. SG538B]|uniref:hypothetical protein n=1 Tax=Mucilaginibacter sp. SG538B TaxID=2587021 RepID=UPI00159E5141|nr:hypothetical protein [Mucilaginibacter sp. SG538B]
MCFRIDIIGHPRAVLRSVRDRPEIRVDPALKAGTQFTFCRRIFLLERFGIAPLMVCARTEVTAESKMIREMTFLVSTSLSLNI